MITVGLESIRGRNTASNDPYQRSTLFIKTQTETMLNAQINSALSKLDQLEPVSEEYAAIVAQISALHKLKTEERSKPLSPDTVLVVAANIFGILWLARYERENVIKSRTAMSFVLKPR